MTRVLVAGGGGFLGRHALPFLTAAGCEVHVASRRPAPANGVRSHAVDLLAPGAPERLIADVGPQIVLHAAWTVEHGRFWTAPDNLDWVAATLRLARAASDAGVARFVGVGTCVEYDWDHAPGQPRRETDPLGPRQLYGEAKAATFRLLARAFDDAAMQFAWGRIFHPFGVGEPAGKLVSSLVSALRRGETVEVRSGPLVRDFIAAEDAGRALAALALSPVAGAVNIASGQAVSIRDLAGQVLALCPGDGRVVFRDAPQGAEPAVMSADVSRLRHEVGLAAPAPLHVRLAQFIAEPVQ
jgi:nucleoside-diphosphate-sugar epimerase